MSRIRVTEKDHIAHVVLTRAEKKNAMDDAMIDALIAAGEEIARSKARAVILSGAGDCFCAGIDISGLTKVIGQDMEALILPRTHGQGTTNRWQEVAMVWHRLPMPVIAALHGAVYGAGLQLSLGADIRIAAPDTQLAVMEMKWGIVPDMGGMVLLPRLLRDDVMKRLIYTAEPISAEQAAQWGLVTEIAENPLAAATALAEKIALKGPNAIRAAKALCHLAHEAPAEAVLQAEAQTQAGLLGQPEQMEVIAAQFGKRAPVFK
jgi:enoyl-CoA hydratase/carnithine racemase